MNKIPVLFLALLLSLSLAGCAANSSQSNTSSPTQSVGQSDTQSDDEMNTDAPDDSELSLQDAMIEMDIVSEEDAIYLEFLDDDVVDYIMIKFRVNTSINTYDPNGSYETPVDFWETRLYTFTADGEGKLTIRQEFDTLDMAETYCGTDRMGTLMGRYHYYTEDLITPIKWTIAESAQYMSDEGAIVHSRYSLSSYLSKKPY